VKIGAGKCAGRGEHNGTQAERQASAAEIEQDRLWRAIKRSTIWTR
jgi:hypothetical protein